MYPTGQGPPTTAQQPIAIAISQNLPKVGAYQSRQAIANGILQIIVGVFCLLLNSVSLGLYVRLRTDWGFSGGVFYIITGSLGIAVGKKITECLMIAHMVLCIIAASLFAPIHFAAFVYLAESYRPNHYYHPYASSPYIIEVIQAVLVAIEFVFAVWGSTIWCKAVGCCSDAQAIAAVQTVQIINGQPIIVVQSPGDQLAPFVTQQPPCPSYPMPLAPSHAGQEKKY